MPALGSIFRNVFLIQTPSSLTAVIIPIDMLISEKKFKEKSSRFFKDEPTLIISFNTALFSG